MLMLRDPKTDWDVVYLPPPLKGVRPPPVPILQSEASESGGILSPDGRWVLYESNESGSDVFEAYVAAFPSGGHRRQVSSGGVDQTSARWTPAGEILFANRMKLMSASARPVGDALEIAPPRVLFETSMDCNSFELSCFDITLDGKRILLLQATGPPPAVELVQHWTAALNK